MRYLAPFIEKDLNRHKMVFLSGPRQVGKTTFAQSLIDRKNDVYLNFDIASDRRIILDQSWNKSSRRVIFDEIHKFKKWKNLLKGAYDAYGKNQSFFITGSARLDLFRKSGDALTGRYFHYHLHPIDLHESLSLMPELGISELTERLLKHGGFPESFFQPRESARLGKNRIEQVLNEDVRDLTRINDIKSLELLVLILREMNGGSLNFDHLAKKLQVSAPTVKKWIELLEKLYLIFRVTPFSNSSAKSFRKESKFYFFDAALNLNEEGFALENLVALSLKKYCDFMCDTQGAGLSLHYYRDADKREVDFVITENRKPILLIEVKKSDSSFSKNLIYLHEKHPKAKAVQLVQLFEGSLEKQNVQIFNLSHWLVNELYPKATLMPGK